MVVSGEYLFDCHTLRIIYLLFLLMLYAYLLLEAIEFDNAVLQAEQDDAHAARDA
jgi:hypothetical protein